MATNNNSVYDVLVIGGGVVGLTVLRSATLHGWRCALVEREPHLLLHASGSNSGIVCTGVDASPGTLERALIRDSIAQIRPFCERHNVPTRPCGSLVCHWPWDHQNSSNEEDESSLERVLEESWEAGDTHARKLLPEEVLELEPNLADCCQGAVLIPGEIVVDPWLFSIALAAHARENGADIFTNFSFDPETSSWDDATKLWTVGREISEAESDQGTERMESLKARSIVNAAGIHADLLQSSVTPAAWTARPRRGQYRIFSSRPSTKIDHPIQPVPTQFTKGIFVFSTIYDQIVVGPTALDQESRTDRTANPAVAEVLAGHAKRILPELDFDNDYVGEYVGIRPGSDRRDYQIRLHPPRHWIAVASIRSTGLTASLGIGRHVTHLLGAILPEPAPPSNIQTTPLPSVSDLVTEYHKRSDEKVTIHGHEYRVTHPLTRFGWEAKNGSEQSC